MKKTHKFYQKLLPTKHHHHSQLPALNYIKWLYRHCGGLFFFLIPVLFERSEFSGIKKRTNHHNDDKLINYKKPLLIACSGGGGHISAINGIIDTLLTENLSKNLIVKQHKLEIPPRSLYGKLLSLSIWALSNRLLNNLFHNVLIKWAINGLPPYKDYLAELQRLYNTSQTNGKPYLDMLLDVYPAGYEFVAIFNTLQRGDYLTNINKIVNAQPRSDRMNYKHVYAKILAILCNEANHDLPYTEIISTQSQSLAAICDAVHTYNQHHQPIIINQYLTEMTTIAAHHFFIAIQNLTKTQQQYIKIHAVCDKISEIQACLTNPENFSGIEVLSKYHNPMVRSEFKNPLLKDLYPFDQECQLIINTKIGSKTLTIPAHAKIAAIILGSLAGCASIDYAKYLSELNEYKFIFVFRSGNQDLDKKLENLSNNILCLEYQPPQTLASIIMRSNCVILRGGGLSTMENMALPIIHGKKFYFHHPEMGNENKTQDSLSTGLSWEDSNIDQLIKHIRENAAYAWKTTPQTIRQI